MSPTSNDSDRSLRRGPLGPGVSEAGNIASYGARMSTVQPDNPTSTILPPTRSPTRGKYPPFRGTTVTLLPSTSKIPMQAENIRVPTLNALSPRRWSPSARSSPGATTCLGSATITKVFSLTLVEDLHLDSSLCHLANPVCE